MLQKGSDLFNSLLNKANETVDEISNKAKDLLPPAFSPESVNPNDFTGMKTFVKPYDGAPVPVSAGALVSIEGGFGEIKISAWDQQVVRVQANITIGAETAAKAMEIANATQPSVTSVDKGKGLEIRTKFPEGYRFRIDYTITVPRDASINCANYFGDTVVHGVGGDVTLRSANGRVELRDLAKPARVWARGNAPLYAQALRQGGEFMLQDSQATFVEVGGTLRVNQFMGSVEVRELAPECDMNISSSGGPIQVFLGQNDTPDIDATALYGEVNSGLQLTRTVQSNIIHAVSLNKGSPQRLSLITWFESVTFNVEGLPAMPALELDQGGEPVMNPVPGWSEPVAQGSKLVIEAIAGDVRVEGVDDAAVTVQGTKHLRVNSLSSATQASEALVMRKEAADGAVKVVTTTDRDPLTLGALSYRVDVTVKCPRNVPIEIRAKNGHTTVTGMAAPVVVEQAEGTVLAEGVTGDVNLRNDKGDVQALECGGKVEINAAYGTVATRNAKGPQRITSQQGKVVIDAPLGEVYGRSLGGDISIIALSGIGGNYDVAVEKGNIRMMMLATADAAVFLTAEQGEVEIHNDMNFSGTLGKGMQQFQCPLGKSTFTVTLRSKEGSIAID